MITLADKKKLQKLANKMNPTTPQSLRQEHFVLKKKYKKLANKTYKRYKNQLLNETNTLNSNQSGEFWKLINKIRKSETFDESSDIPPEDWIKHFHDLLYDAEETQESHTVFNPSIKLDESTLSDEILNGPITVKEIHDQIYKLNNKKAPGKDTLLNEMIKHGRYYLMPSLERIFTTMTSLKRAPFQLSET